MKRSLTIITLSLLFINSALAQQKIDYLEVRKDLVKSTCTTTDAEIYKQDLANLLALDTATINKGLSEYFYDLGMLYYAHFGNNEGKFHPEAFACMKRCVELDKKNGSAYLNLSIMYYFTKNIPLAKEYAQFHKKYTRKKYRDNDFLARIESL
jgi:lipoprotein NlpI